MRTIHKSQTRIPPPFVYSEDELREWAETIKNVQPGECYAYFNNDYQAHAVGNCRKLGEQLGRTHGERSS